LDTYDNNLYRTNLQNRRSALHLFTALHFSISGLNPICVFGRIVREILDHEVFHEFVDGQGFEFCGVVADVQNVFDAMGGQA
jgi:hypothetical protein